MFRQCNHYILCILALMFSPLYGRQRAQGWCEVGNQVVVTSSVNSTTKVQRSFPQCTVTVYNAGTLTLSTIYSDNSGTSQANPFTATTDGYWGFYANNGNYDVRLSGAGISSPFTMNSVWLFDESVLIIDVTKYGAIGDGTTDNTTALQNALNANSGYISKQVVIPPAGNCYKTKTLTIPSDTTLTGGGCILLDDDGTTTSYTLYINSKSRVTISNLTIQQTASSRTGVYGNIRINASSNISVLNCRIIGGVSTGIHVIQSTDLLFQGNYIQDTWADGIHVSRGSARVRIIGNEMNHVGDDGVGLIGYYSDGGSPYGVQTDIAVIGNNIYNLRKAFGRGVAIYGSAHVVISGNTINNTYDAGILVGAIDGTTPGLSTYYPYQITITGNTVTQTGQGGGAQGGIFVSFARSVIVSDNIVYDIPVDGISVSFVAKDVTISNNDVSRVPRPIIAEQHKSTDSRLIQELFTDLGDTGLTTVGISKIKIMGNTSRDSTQGGILLTGETDFHSSGFTVAGNHVYEVNGVGTNGRGILLNFVDVSTVSNNEVVEAGDDGIRIAGATGCSITANVVNGSGLDGISLVTTDHAIVTGNFVTGSAHGGIYSDPGSSDNFITGNIATDNTDFNVQVDTTIGTTVAFSNLGSDYGVGYGTSGPLLDFPSGLYIGGVSANQLIKRIGIFTGVENPSAIAANTCAARNLTATGLVTSDTLISVTKPTAQAGLSMTPVTVPSLGGATVNFCNNTASPITPTPGETYTFVVIH